MENSPDGSFKILMWRSTAHLSSLRETSFSTLRFTAIALSDPWFLGVMSSRFHEVWALFTSVAHLEIGPYHNTTCFDPFPFPDGNDFQKERVRACAEELDDHRKRVPVDHPPATLA